MLQPLSPAAGRGWLGRVPLAPVGPQGKRRRPAGAPLQALGSAVFRVGRRSGEQDQFEPEKGRLTAQGTEMDQHQIEELKTKVGCAAVLEQQGWAIDAKESTARAVKYRRAAGEIIIVIHRGAGWFDPLSDAKGDVFSLARHLLGAGFPEAVEQVARLVGVVPAGPTWHEPERAHPILALAERWTRRPLPSECPASWRYLAEERAIPAPVLSAALARDLLRGGPAGSMWAAHRDDAGRLTGWEERGPEWRGFSTGGVKVLFRLGDSAALRVCVAEAAIDAMSLAALDGMRADTLYVSTGGGWSPATDTALRVLAARPGTVLVAATDNDRQGEIYAGRLEALSASAGAAYARLTPQQQDWNCDLAAHRPADGNESGDEEADPMPRPASSCQGRLRPTDAGP